jgi:NitT/TauT family transport system substrate-binding protein/putative hydroxymethylpyrimidine transport system substrate-binding protein
MKRAAALLAAATLLLAACGGSDGGGAEPGAPRGATLVLDFTPNAVHAGIYAALREGYYADHGVDLTVRQPSASTDAPKLLEAGRADFAILDIHDLAIARQRGLDVVGVAPIVDRPLAAVIAGNRSAIRTPADLAGKTVGVTGLPSDDAVLDTVLASAGLAPNAVHRVTIGFGAVPALAAGRIDAATAFWNAEGVTLRRHGVPVRSFRVDDFGAPRYPELWLTTTRSECRTDPGLVREMTAATARGYALAVRQPGQALGDLLAANPGLDQATEHAELHALLAAHALQSPLSTPATTLVKWARWELDHGIVHRPATPRSLLGSC